MVSLAPLFPPHLPRWSQTQSNLSAVFFFMYDTLSCHPGTSSSRGPFQKVGRSTDKQWIYDGFQRKTVFLMPVNRMDIVDTFARLHPRHLQLLNFE